MNNETTTFNHTTSLSVSPNKLDEYKYNTNVTEMSQILSPSQNTNDFVTSILNDLHNKFEDVDLDCDNYITYHQFLDVMGEFYIQSAYIIDDGYTIIWDKMLIEQNYHYDYNNNMLYIPFILKYMKEFIIKSIHKLNINTNNIRNLNTFYDEILSLSLKLIYKIRTNETDENGNDNGVNDMFSEIATITSFASESGCNTFTRTPHHDTIYDNNENKHILIQKAIKSFIKLSNNFPVITTRKQLTMNKAKTNNNITNNITNFDNYSSEDADYLNLMNGLMATASGHASPKLMKMRVKKTKKSQSLKSQKKLNRKRYNLVSIDNADTEQLSSLSESEESSDIDSMDNGYIDSENDSFEEIAVDQIKLNEIYNQQKKKKINHQINKHNNNNIQKQYKK
eukprot:364634_1